jgi:hypothetical protein
MLKLRTPYANRLARRLKSWHARQGDPLSLARCQHVVAVLHGHVSWPALQAAAAATGEPDLYTSDIGRLTQLGYPPDAAGSLVACLSSVTPADDAPG